jgi:hypothetical protein
MVEYVADLAERARTLLAGLANVRVVAGNAHHTSTWSGARKVHCGFCIAALPEAWARPVGAVSYVGDRSHPPRGRPSVQQE